MSKSRLRIGRNTEACKIDEDLRRVVPVMAVRVSGYDSRTLQTTVTVACNQGLEIQDLHGHLLRAAARLTIAQGYARHGRRLRHRWTVIVTAPTTAVPDGVEHYIEGWGTRVAGRRVVFARGATFDLSHGDTF